MSQEIVVKPRGPHHCAACFASVQAANTTSRGASNVRVIVSPRCPASLAALSLARILVPPWPLRLDPGEIVVQAVEALFPEPPVIFDPIGGAPERRRVEPAGSPLRCAAARNEPGARQPLQMLRHRGQAHRERLGQFADGRLSRGEPRQDRSPRRVGQCRKGFAQSIGHRRYLSDRLINSLAKYYPRKLMSTRAVTLLFRGLATPRAGIHEDRLWNMDSGFTASRRPGMTNWGRVLGERKARACAHTRATPKFYERSSAISARPVSGSFLLRRCAGGCVRMTSRVGRTSPSRRCPPTTEPSDFPSTAWMCKA